MITALEDAENNAAGAIAAEKALVLWGEEVKGALLEASLRGPPQIRPRALRALGRIGGVDLGQPLRALLRDPIPAVRTQAAAALAQISGAQAVELIAPLLEDRDKWVRYGVAEALVHAGSPRGQAVLEEAGKDPEEEGTYLRFWAEELLDEIEELKRTGRAIP
jgi:HEAT repeat protein